MNSKDFKQLITYSDSSTGETIEIYYYDGTVVEKLVQKVSLNYNPAYVNECKV
jgi:hypothetical protein